MQLRLKLDNLKEAMSKCYQDLYAYVRNKQNVQDKKMLNIMSTFNKWPSSTGVSRLFHWGWWQNLSAQFALKNLPLKLIQFCTTLCRLTVIARIGHS